jgi:hypothetical protein
LISTKDENRNHRRKTKEDEGYLQIRIIKIAQTPGIHRV